MRLMLVELSITDFAIIDTLRVPFEPGFNALTGETGAGKSIVIDALGAVLGDRIGSDVVRTGAKVARIEATFDVGALAGREDFSAVCAELGVEPEDDTLILTREIAASGRSSARINGRAATASALAAIGQLLVDIHGQSEHLSLLRPAEHLDILDRYAGLLPQRERVAELVREVRQVRATIAGIEGSARERAQRADLLAFQSSEIAGARLRPGEEEELLSERTVLSNAERLAVDAARAYALIAGDDEAVEAGQTPALEAIRQASAELTAIASLDESVGPLATRLAEQLYLLEDIAGEARDYRDRIEADPARLEEVEERLDLIKSLKRKYGATIEEIIAFGEQATRELESITSGEENIDVLRERETDLVARLSQGASELSCAREAAAQRLARATEQAIADLKMGRARFDVAIARREADGGIPYRTDDETRQVAFDETGIDRVEFLLAPNAGEALKPLARVASGGEMARLMLALKSILSAGDATPTLVFDEVDVGVGGRSGQVVGEKLWSLADNHQVIVITHLAQIAAFAGTHFRIRKAERAGRVTSTVEQVAAADRIDELAAMLDGVPVTAASRANADALLDRVNAWIGEHRIDHPTPAAVGRR
jgi:DNA repair protein RecN (Recombination protein N)